MKIKELFKELEKQTNGKEAIFEDSKITNKSNILDWGFFPLGSGILADDESSKTQNAILESNGIMFLGNDFGCETYIYELINSTKKEKETNPTINNLHKTFNYNKNKCFFTNLHLGIRPGNSNILRLEDIKEDYQNLCVSFFYTQLEFARPKYVVCLGKEVIDTLVLHKIIDAKTKGKSYKYLLENNLLKQVIKINNCDYTFLFVSHPSYAHINWGGRNSGTEIINFIKNEINL